MSSCDALYWDSDRTKHSPPRKITRDLREHSARGAPLLRQGRAEPALAADVDPSPLCKGQQADVYSIRLSIVSIALAHPLCGRGVLQEVGLACRVD